MTREMKNIPTPRTDTFIRETEIKRVTTVAMLIDTEDFARTLERELTLAQQEIASLKKQFGLIPDMVPLPDYGELMTAEEWESFTKAGFGDGSGYWATDKEMDHNASAFSANKPDWATHVMYFGK